MPSSVVPAPETTFRIPVARDRRGRLVAPDEARRGDVYRCPSCDGTVDLHAGERKRRHFHHRASTCSSETVLHLSAKLLVVQAVAAWLEGGPGPVFDRACAEPTCGRRTRQPMPKKVARAAVEHRLPSGHVVDVALLAAGLDLPVAAVEILHTHAVDERKATAIGVPWIEVEAAQVCDAGGLVLVATRDRFLPWTCDEHSATPDGPLQRREARRREKRIAEAVSLSEFPGYRIERVTTCPRGHDAPVLAWDGKEPPWPRPPCIVAIEEPLDWTHRGGLRRVMPFRRSWACVCPRCGERLA